jgi:hypothetical protein
MQNIAHLQVAWWWGEKAPYYFIFFCPFLPAKINKFKKQDCCGQKKQKVGEKRQENKTKHLFVVFLRENKIYMYNFAHIETVSNPKSLFALCPPSQNILLYLFHTGIFKFLL